MIEDNIAPDVLDAVEKAIVDTVRGSEPMVRWRWVAVQAMAAMERARGDTPPAPADAPLLSPERMQEVGAFGAWLEEELATGAATGGYVEMHRVFAAGYQRGFNADSTLRAAGSYTRPTNRRTERTEIAEIQAAHERGRAFDGCRPRALRLDLHRRVLAALLQRCVGVQPRQRG